MKQFSLKTNQEIKIMLEGGERLSKIKDFLLRQIRIGRKAEELEIMAEKKILEFGGEPSFKTVKDYKWAICLSINDEVVHGIPKGKIIKENDVVKIDIGMFYKGFHTDTAWTVQVKSKNSDFNSSGDNEVQKFLKVGRETLQKAINAVRPGGRIGEISKTIQDNLRVAGYSPVDVLTGHGIGRVLHEDPPIPQILIGKVENTPKILPGMTLAIEVIYNLGKSEIVLKSDGWTFATKDGKISATFEKSIAVVKDGIIILTP